MEHLLSDGEDWLDIMTLTICCRVVSMALKRWLTASGDAGGDVGVNAGRWLTADRVLIEVPEPPNVDDKFGESPLSESLGFMLA